MMEIRHYKFVMQCHFFCNLWAAILKNRSKNLKCMKTEVGLISKVSMFNMTLWKVRWKRLTTQDRLPDRRQEEPLNFFFCCTGHESRKHLFFECSYSMDSWQTVMIVRDEY